MAEVPEIHRLTTEDAFFKFWADLEPLVESYVKSSGCIDTADEIMQYMANNLKNPYTMLGVVEVGGKAVGFVCVMAVLSTRGVMAVIHHFECKIPTAPDVFRGLWKWIQDNWEVPRERITVLVGRNKARMTRLAKSAGIPLRVRQTTLGVVENE